MYKLCLAFALLAVAAAKPNWPLAYSYPALSSVYSSAYPSFGSAVYPAPYQPYSVVANTYSAAPVAAPLAPAAFASTYSYSAPSAFVKPFVAAPVAPVAATVAAPYTALAAPGYPSTYAAAIGAVGVAPYSGYAYGTPFWKK